MLLVAMLVIVILGTIGLVIELGIARVNRNRMQSAADSTALEVLRERDYLPPGGENFDPVSRDHSRRDRNRHVASWVFADEVLTDYGTQTEGPGSYIKMSSAYGTSGNPMNRGLVVEEVGYDIPILQTNYNGEPGNGSSGISDPGGDIVAGHFKGHDDGVPVGHGGNPIHREDSDDYSRFDFEMPSSPEAAPFADSVLVRLRRTSPYGQEGTSPFSMDDVPGARSTGYTMPLLFGLGTTFLSKEPGDGYSVRHHGLALRATSIAQARPAVRIGAPGGPGTPPEWAVGAGPIVIRLAFWENDATFEDIDGEVAADVRLRPNHELETLGDDDFLFGYLYPKDASQVGDEVNPDALESDAQYLEPAYWEVDECYVPIYLRAVQGGELHVTGFGRVRIEEIETPAGQTDEDGPFLRVTKLKNSMSPGEPWLAPRNASATFDGRQPAVVFPSANNRDWNSLIEKLYILPEVGEGAPFLRDARVYAPAHVR